MNRLETRIKRLEETAIGDDGDVPQLLGVTRIYLDQFGNEMKSEFLLEPVTPLLIAVPREPEPVDPDNPPEPILTSYRDEPWLLSTAQFKELLKAISGQSRTI
jgi:hypothetical protein